ncbi:unnamed protein product [Rotaria socialis]|uniref:EF-hand domain-containing protein n=1 Tax=Rotaria socialis TaxID=392032 RepID=A0A817ZYE1_9BILA|nr:unnamed protein product [Rotaria socialis]
MSSGETSDAFLQQVFRKVDADGSGAISSNELQSALSNGTWSPFNPETVRMMIGMFDKDNSSTIDFNEFKLLWNYITQWEKIFRSFDEDRSGSIDKNEFRKALMTFGMFDRDGSSTIDFKEFRALWHYVTEWEKCFRRFDLDGSGTIDKHELKIALSSFGMFLFVDILWRRKLFSNSPNLFNQCLSLLMQTYIHDTNFIKQD